jgi:surface antigen
MRLKTVLAATLIALMTAACAQNGQYGTKQTIGGLGGAAAGGLLGAQFGSGSGKLAATAAGVLIGALIGSEIGRSMDEVDRMKAEQAYNQAATAPIGQTIAWDNPNTGNYGSVVPTREGTNTSTGQYCREFQQTVVIGGRQEDAYGTACRRPDGSWEIQ